MRNAINAPALKNALIKTHFRPMVGSKRLQISRALVIHTWTSQSATDGKINETVSLLCFKKCHPEKVTEEILKTHHFAYISQQHLEMRQ